VSWRMEKVDRRVRVLLVWWLAKGVRGWPWWTLMPASTL
jgi:hypothetical protein